MARAWTRWLAVAGAAAVTAVGGASGASAAAFTVPGSATVSDQPSVAVDGSGNAYVAWLDSTGSGTTPQVVVCAIPAGGATCAQEKTLQGSTTYDEGVRPYVVIDATGRPNVIIAGYNGAGGSELQYVSSDGGATWSSSPTSIGDMPISSAAFDPKIGPGVLFGTAINAPLSKNATVGAGGAALGVTGSPGHDATLVPNGTGVSTPLYTGTAESDTAAGIALASVWDTGVPGSPTGVGYAYYSGPALAGLDAPTTVADVGTDANWTKGTLGDSGRNISLTGGPAGIFANEEIGNAGEVAIRQFTGSGFTAPSVADCGDTPTYHAGLQSDSMAEDPQTGALQFVYIESREGADQDLRYTELATGTQSPPVTLTSTTTTGMVDPAVASNGATHPGIAVWLTATPTNYAISASWLPPVALTGCAAPASTGPGTGTGTGPGTGTGQTTTTTATVGGIKLVLSAPSPTVCQGATGHLAASLTSQAPKAKKGSRIKLRQATFTIDRGVKRIRTVKVAIRGKHGKKRFRSKKVTRYLANATAHTLPATVRLSLKGLKRGTHTLSVKVTFVQTKGKTKLTLTTTLKTRFTVC